MLYHYKVVENLYWVVGGETVCSSLTKGHLVAEEQSQCVGKLIMCAPVPSAWYWRLVLFSAAQFLVLF